MRIHILFLMVALANYCFAQEETPISGGQDYNQNINQHLAHITEGRHSEELYMNLGYAYYQKNDLANAMLYYEKALKLGPRNNNIQESINQIRAELPIQISDIPDFVLLRAYRSMSNFASATTWSIIQLLFGLLFVVGLYLIFIKDIEIRKSLAWGSMSSLLIFCLISGLMAYHSKLTELGGDQAISMQSQELYEAADDRSNSIVSIGPGNKVFLLDTIGDWYKVQLRDKDTGWVKKDRVSII